MPGGLSPPTQSASCRATRAGCGSFKPGIPDLFGSRLGEIQVVRLAWPILGGCFISHVQSGTLHPHRGYWRQMEAVYRVPRLEIPKRLAPDRRLGAWERRHSSDFLVSGAVEVSVYDRGAFDRNCTQPSYSGISFVTKILFIACGVSSTLR